MLQLGPATPAAQASAQARDDHARNADADALERARRFAEPLLAGQPLDRHPDQLGQGIVGIVQHAGGVDERRGHGRGSERRADLGMTGSTRRWCRHTHLHIRRTGRGTPALVRR